MTGRTDEPERGTPVKTRKTPVEKRKEWDPANYGDPDEKVDKDDRADGRPPAGE